MSLKMLPLLNMQIAILLANTPAVLHTARRSMIHGIMYGGGLQSFPRHEIASPFCPRGVMPNLSFTSPLYARESGWQAAREECQE